MIVMQLALAASALSRCRLSIRRRRRMLLASPSAVLVATTSASQDIVFDAYRTDV